MPERPVPRRHLPLLAILPIALLSLSACSTASRIVQPFGVDDPLPTAEPSEVGLDPNILHSMSRQIAAKGRHELHSLLVVRRDRLALEQYYNGHSRDTPHDLRSATKSITSLLTGIAIERRVIAGVDSPVMDYLAGEYPDIHDKNHLTVRHLLTMSSGLDCHDRDRGTRGQEDRMYRSEDWVRYFLSLRRVSAAGEQAFYCTGGVVALGHTLAAGAGTRLDRFADETLFAPLGIRNYRWASFDRDRKIDSGGHLLLTPQGMVKIGLLALHKGRWQGKQLVPESWMELSTREHTKVDGRPYGFLWWRTPLRYGERELTALTARGNGGQMIAVVPELEMVVVTTAGYYNSKKSRIADELLYRAIIPAALEADRKQSEIAQVLGKPTVTRRSSGRTQRRRAASTVGRSRSLSTDSIQPARSDGRP